DGAQIPLTEIRDRLILSLCNEAVSSLKDRVVEEEELLDAGIIFGTGFAPFRGGPVRYIRTRGAQETKKTLLGLSEKYGKRFMPGSGWNTLTG
ncbi:MAG: hypothetical protein ACE5FU_07300, partial [Nitrospinota bacterium]